MEPVYRDAFSDFEGLIFRLSCLNAQYEMIFAAFANQRVSPDVSSELLSGLLDDYQLLYGGLSFVFHSLEPLLSCGSFPGRDSFSCAPGKAARKKLPEWKGKSPYI